MTNKTISALTSATTPLAGTEILPIVQSGSTVKVAVSDLTAGRTISCTGVTTTGNGARITGDMSTGTIANRLAFQTSTINGATALELIPNGTRTSGNPATQVVLEDANSVATGNGSIAVISNIQDTEFRLQASIRGTGSYLPISVYTNNKNQWQFDTAGSIVQKVALNGINFTANSAAAGMTSQLLNWYEEGTWTPVLKFGGATTGITYTTQTGTYTRIGRMVHARATIVLSSNGSASGGALVTGLPYTVAVTTAASIYQSGISYAGSLNVAVEGTVDRFTIQQVSALGVNSNLDRLNFSNTANFTLAVCYQV